VTPNEETEMTETDLSPLEIAQILAPGPETEADSTAKAWSIHYAATAFAAFTEFHTMLKTLTPNPAPGSRPELGRLVALGVAATAAYAALSAEPGEDIGELLWAWTPECGALNGEYLDELTEALDEAGINPADIDPEYSAGDFASPSRRAELMAAATAETTVA